MSECEQGETESGRENTMCVCVWAKVNQAGTKCLSYQPATPAGGYAISQQQITQIPAPQTNSIKTNNLLTKFKRVLSLSHSGKWQIESRKKKELVVFYISIFKHSIQKLRPVN